MKTNLLYSVVVMLLGYIGYAQQKPTLEKEGELIKATYYHDNGQVAQCGFYKDGKPHGEWKQFDSEGSKSAIGHYENGRKTGKWFFWNNDTLSEVNYQESRIASVQHWKESGTLAVNRK
ncbi:MAG: nicotinic acid mononucleotide adenyltransferase [Capnocytophaga sp.]|nr:nicotinic acid mononucleotide adenyltransferase [Capnocytophaga sp.]